jgi:hypothetical protein
LTLLDPVVSHRIDLAGSSEAGLAMMQ